MSTTATGVETKAITNPLAKMGYPEKGKNNLLPKAKSLVRCAIGNLPENILTLK